jgi:hypothetical protein
MATGCLGPAVVEQAVSDLGSPSDYGIPGTFCAIAVKNWMERAARALGVSPPISGSPGAKNTRDQFIADQSWLTVTQLRSNPSLVQPGMIAVWHRGEPGACTGHTGVVETAAFNGQTFGTIEANAAPVVSRFQRRLDSATLLGMGYFRCSLPPAAAIVGDEGHPWRNLAIGSVAIVSAYVAYRYFKTGRRAGRR